MTQHNAGTVRAAKRVSSYLGGLHVDHETIITNIIDNETHAAEMLAFIKKVGKMGMVSLADHAALIALKREAQELIEKVRG